MESLWAERGSVVSLTMSSDTTLKPGAAPEAHPQTDDGAYHRLKVTARPTKYGSFRAFRAAVL
ncbi:hypothetical protein M1E17_05290 [Arthrobacter sp. D1-29]